MKIELGVSPLDYAKSLTAADLKKIIKSCKKGEYDEFTDRCRICFEKVLAGDWEQAEWWSRHAELAKDDH